MTWWRAGPVPSLPLSATVFCFWLLMNDEISVGQVVMALALALLIPLFAARLDREFARIGRLQPHAAGTTACRHHGP